MMNTTNDTSAEKKKKAPPRRNRRVLLLALLIFMGVCYALVGFSINIPRLRPIDRLDEARAKWAARGIDDYRMRVRFFSYSVLESVWITVQDEQVTRIDLASALCGNDACLTYNPAATTPLAPDVAWYTGSTSSFNAGAGKYLLPRLDDYTMPTLFEFAATKLKDEPPSPLMSLCNSTDGTLVYKATYDESQGYIKTLRLTNCIEWQVGGGLMCGTITHCESGFSVESLEPLPESTP